MLLWGPQNNNAGRVIDLLWTGKGVSEGWAGFSEVKVSLLWAGISQYLVRGANIGAPSIVQLMWVELLSASTFITVVAVLSIAILWRERRTTQARVLASIFGVTFAAGEVLKNNKKVKVMPFDGLMRDFVKEQLVKVMVRGVRIGTDFDYEFQLAGMNRQLMPDVETVFLNPKP